ncbi:unnamed protein product [Paramecium primaurelia]|uniref:Transmembrane protein n=1 Tax=Paramecium primaurelia TaxID=5886 RepID=A0A8S1N2N1_PARPR|nr:unnamed protein product [Paramecium primaurelia]
MELIMQVCLGTWYGVLSLILIVIWTFQSIAFSWRSLDRLSKLSAQLTELKISNQIIFKLNQVIVILIFDHQSILLKLLINYVLINSVKFAFSNDYSFLFQFIEQTFQYSLFYFKQFGLLFIKNQQHRINLPKVLIYTHKSSTLFIYCKLFRFDINLKQYKINRIASILSIRGCEIRIWQLKSLILDLLFLFYLNQYYQVASFLFSYFYQLIEIIQINQTEKTHICSLLNEYQNQNNFWEQIKNQKTFYDACFEQILKPKFEIQILFKAYLLGLCQLIYQNQQLNQLPFITKFFNSLNLKDGRICSIVIFLAAIKYICESKNIDYAQNQRIQFSKKVLLSYRINQVNNSIHYKAKVNNQTIEQILSLEHQLFSDNFQKVQSEARLLVSIIKSFLFISFQSLIQAIYNL